MRTFILAVSAALVIAFGAWAFPGHLLVGGGGNQTASPPPGSITCAIGKPYTLNGGTVPAGAAAAGFNTCALNVDMSNPYYQTLSNWLDCSREGEGGQAAVTPILYNQFNTGWNVGGNSTPCSAGTYSVVNDGGTTALKIQVPAATQGIGQSLRTVAEGDLGQGFPQTYYIEARFRTDASDNSVCHNGNDNAATCTPFTIYYYQFSSPPSTKPWAEWDYIEIFTSSFGDIPSGGKDLESFHNPESAFGGCLNPTQYLAGGSGGTCPKNVDANLGVYHTIANRVVSDGTANLSGTTTGNYARCSYLDGTQQTCASGGYFNPAGAAQDLFQTRELITIQNYFTNVTGGSNLSGPQIGYLTNLTIWECSGWQAATPVTDSGNNCLNSTAAVTGALAGPP